MISYFTILFRFPFIPSLTSLTTLINPNPRNIYNPLKFITRYQALHYPTFTVPHPYSLKITAEDQF